MNAITKSRFRKIMTTFVYTFQDPGDIDLNVDCTHEMYDNGVSSVAHFIYPKYSLHQEQIGLKLEITIPGILVFLNILATNADKWFHLFFQ